MSDPESEFQPARRRFRQADARQRRDGKDDTGYAQVVRVLQIQWRMRVATGAIRPSPIANNPAPAVSIMTTIMKSHAPVAKIAQAQHDSFAMSLSNAWAASLRPSTVVR